MSIKERARKIKADLPALWLTLKDKNTPLAAKILAGITVAYTLSPVDLIPDFIPILGYLDDMVILPALIALTIKLIPKEVFDNCRERSDGLWKSGIPKRWYYAIPIVVIWIAFIMLIVVKII